MVLNNKYENYEKSLDKLNQVIVYNVENSGGIWDIKSLDFLGDKHDGYLAFGNQIENRLADNITYETVIEVFSEEPGLSCWIMWTLLILILKVTVVKIY